MVKRKNKQVSRENHIIRGPLYYAFLRFLSNKAALISGVILSIIILMSIFAPLITSTGYEEQKFLTNNLAFPSWSHWFGIDDLGRDFYTRIIYGARVSLSIGFIAAVFSVFIGLPLGALAGYYGGKIDWLIMRIIELFSVIPPLMAALLLASLVKGGFLSIIFIAALFGWVQICLLVRAQVLSFKEKPHDTFINGGFFVISKNSIKQIKDIKTYWEIEPLKYYLKKEKLYAFKHEGFWKSLDTLKDKGEFNNICKNKKKYPWKI